MGLEAEASDAEVVRAVLAGGVEGQAGVGRRYRGRYERFPTRMVRAPGLGTQPNPRRRVCWWG